MIGLLGSLLEDNSLKQQGFWDASTNTPTLTNGVGVQGYYYVVSVGGTVNFGAGNITFTVGDLVYYNTANQWVKFGTGGGGGSGDVVGPASSTDNALARYNLATGKLIQNSGVFLDDSNNFTGIANLSLSDNQTFSGLGKKIFGDFSNATRANRLALETSTVNGNTRIPILPNGTARLSGIDCHDGSDADNSSFLQVHSDGVNNHCGLNSAQIGTGARKDLVFQIGGITKAQINEADGKFNVDTLTASLLVGTDASKNLQSVTAATSSTGTDFGITLSGATIIFALPDAGALARGVLSTGTQTIAGNKTFSGGISSTRINPRVTSIASASTITPAADTSDQYIVTALAAAATIAIPSGTPVDGQKLLIRIKDNGTARALTWTTSAGGYRAIGITLPTTTVISKVVYLGAAYNSQDGFWDVVAVAQL